jgi:hypothetical protein
MRKNRAKASSLEEQRARSEATSWRDGATGSAERGRGPAIAGVECPIGATGLVEVPPQTIRLSPGIQSVALLDKITQSLEVICGKFDLVHPRSAQYRRVREKQIQSPPPRQRLVPARKHRLVPFQRSTVDELSPVSTGSARRDL